MSNLSVIFFLCLATFFISLGTFAFMSKKAFEHGRKWGMRTGQLSMVVHFMQIYDFHGSDENRRRKFLESAHDVINDNPVSVQFHEDYDSGNTQ